MAELTVDDVEAFTRGRLSASDPVVQDILDAALVRARNYTGQHVSPVVEDDVVVLDGPGGKYLFLPTGKIGSIASIVENGSTVAPADYVVSSSIPRLVFRTNGCWTWDYSAITVTYTHGFTEEEAADWRRAILQMVDRMSREQQSGARSDQDILRKKVDDVEYQWVDWGSAADRAISSVEAVLDHYCLTPSGFA